MGITVAVTRFAANTVTGTQDITTTDLGGLVPKAVYVTITRAITNATNADHAVIGIGMATSPTVGITFGMSDEDAVAASDSYINGTGPSFIYILNPLDGTVGGQAVLDSWITNGMRINWTTAPAAAYLITATFFAGTDLTASVGSQALGNVVNTAHDITAPGFRPDVVFTVCGSALLAQVSWGIVHENGAGVVTQRGLCIGALDAQATMANWTHLRTDGAILETTTAGVLYWYGSFSAFDSQGFTVTTLNAGANSMTLGYLALNFGGVVPSWVGTVTAPAATGDLVVTAPNFRPQYVMMIPSFVEAVATATIDTRAYCAGVSMMDANEQYCNVIGSRDAAADANTISRSSNVAAALVETGANTVDIEATLTSFDATGFTLNFSNVGTVAKLWPALAIGVEAAAPKAPPITNRALRVWRKRRTF